MSVTTTAAIVGDNRVITIALSALQAKVDNLSDDCARKVYEDYWKNYDQFKTNTGTEEEPVLEITDYDNLTNKQKLSILGLETQNHLLGRAKAYYMDNTRETALQTAIEEIENRY